MNWNKLYNSYGFIILKIPVCVHFLQMFPVKVLFDGDNLVKLC